MPQPLRSSHPHLLHPRRILVTQLRRLGDVVLTTALLHDLRRAFPTTSIDFLVGDHAAPLLEHHPLIDERIVYDRDHPLRTWRAVRARRYDWIVDPQSSPRTAPLALVSGAPVRAGFASRVWGLLYTHRLPRAGRASEYVARERQRLLEMLGVPITRARPSLAITSEERAAGRLALVNHGLSDGGPVAAFVVSAGEPAKEWPSDHYATLAENLARDGVRPVALEVPGDATKVARVTSGARSLARIPIAGVRELMSVLSACDVLVSADTGPAHIATALNVPRVTIFGPQPPSAWAPSDDPSVVPVRSASATPDDRIVRDDPRYATIVAEVTPAAVAAGVQRLLAAGHARDRRSR